MYKSYSTDEVSCIRKSDYWHEVIAQTILKVNVSSASDSSFSGRVDHWSLATASLTRLASAPQSYRRLAEHCRAEEAQVLVTVPVQSNVDFRQLGRSTRCSPGQFLVELSEEPYEFGYAHDNVMWVLKAPVAAIEGRIGSARNYGARSYDAMHGAGRLFSDYLQLVIRHLAAGHDARSMALIGTQLTELLALSLQQHPDASESHLTPVRCAHVLRIEAYVQQSLADPELSPRRIAQACGISTRYLHLLFKERNVSLSHWIRDLRLQRAYEALARGDKSTTVAQVAYATGFSDQSKLTHAFRRKFGQVPSDLLRTARTAGEYPVVAPGPRVKTVEES